MGFVDGCYCLLKDLFSKSCSGCSSSFEKIGLNTGCINDRDKSLQDWEFFAIPSSTVMGVNYCDAFANETVEKAAFPAIRQPNKGYSKPAFPLHTAAPRFCLDC